MDFITITNYFAEYGLLFLFVIILLEYMNLPGLPAGIIMPAVGVLVSRSENESYNSTFSICNSRSNRKLDTLLHRKIWRRINSSKISK